MAKYANRKHSTTHSAVTYIEQHQRQTLLVEDTTMLTKRSTKKYFEREQKYVKQKSRYILPYRSRRDIQYWKLKCQPQKVN